MRRARPCLALLDGVAVGADPVSRLSPFALARMALRAAREQRSSVSLWRAMAARAVVVAPTMQPADMSTLLFAFARLRFRDRDMMSRLAEATPAILGQFQARDITYLLAAFARLDVQHKLIFNLFAREISRKLHDFTAAQLGELVYAYARLDLRHDLLLAVLKKRVVEVVKALKPWHLAMVANGFARLGVADERFFTVLAAEICRKISEFPGKPLALVANAYARLGVRNRFLLELLGDEAFRRRGELEPQAVALLLNAHARLQLANPVMYDYFAQDVPRRVKNYSLHSLCLVVSAFAKQRRADAALFEKAGDHVCANASALYPRAVATLLFSFSEVDIRHGVLFYHAPEHVAKHLTAYSTDELFMAARAYGCFQMVHLQLFDAITQALPTRVLAGARAPSLPAGEFEDDPEPLGLEEKPPLISSLVGAFEAYARLNIYEASVVQLFCDAIVKRREELVLPLVVQAARSAAAFSFAHPGLIELAAGQLAQPGEDAPAEELEALARALEELGAGGRTSESRRLILENPEGSTAGALGVGAAQG
uniref:RNA-editing substrate-binding complex 6 protein domain-containing protein n=1 Tax=Alexandrium monilatum TaxID=311494 RepID=A0A7S4Q8F3_9DINO|mmetsp:Transcript_100116/g.298806  ORF Transcript_100116/g.298806 Transcript_100116/m.298806 type:complete len:541 (+) Transcript_100116:223-1845(+)